jgi:membrane-associated phospholipid phosphatase
VIDAPGRPAVRAAEVISQVFTPTLLLAVLSPVVGGLAAGVPAGVAWGLLAMVFTAVIPAVIVDVGVRQGRYTDHHLSRREQRAVPLALAAVSVTTGAVVLGLVGAPRAIVALQVAVLTTLVVATAVTLVWKVSFHLAVVCASAAALSIVGGGWWSLAWLAAPVVAWARLRLRAHTPSQVVAGALVGAGVTGLVLLLAGV